METLRLLVQNLIIIVVLAVTLEMILPNGEMRRYTRTVLGLMIIVAVVQAVSGLSGGGLFKEVEEYAWRSEAVSQQAVDVMEQGRRLEAGNRRQAVDQYKKGVEKQISALVGVDGKVKLVGAALKVQDDPAQKDFGRIMEINLILGREGIIKAVEPVSVAVGGEGSQLPVPGQPPPELSAAASKTARVVANFYNIPQEQVRVSFRE